MSGKCGTYAFNLNSKEGPVGVEEKNLTELNPGDFLQQGDYRFSSAFGWVEIEPNLIGTQVPKSPKFAFLKKQKGTGFFRLK